MSRSGTLDRHRRYGDEECGVPRDMAAVAEYEDEDAPERVEIHFARAVVSPARCVPGAL